MNHDSVLTIETATVNDLSVVQAIGRETYLDHYATLWSEAALNAYLQGDFLDEALHRSLSAPQDHLWLLAKNSSDEVVGFAKINWNKFDPIAAEIGAELQKIYFRATATGKGYGALLMRRIVAEAIARGQKMIWLDVLKSNVDGQRFYETNGYKKLGEIPFATDIQDIGMIVMRRALSFDLQPVLQGELVSLRPLQEDDFEALFAVASDPLIWAQHPMSDRYKPDVFAAFFRDAIVSGGALLALDAKTGEVIGSSRFHGFEAEKSEIEIGWTFLARSRWGGRYNGEMKRLMLQHAFQFVNSVVFMIGPNNIRSQKAIQKIGGVLIGTRTDGNGRESVVYQISASSFFEAQKPIQ